MGARFLESVVDSRLPSRHVEIRRPTSNGCTVALISHAPSPGVSYPPNDDLTISIVRKSPQKKVVRELGDHRESCRDIKGCIYVTPPRTETYWEFDGTPEVLHIAVPLRALGEDYAFFGELHEGLRACATKPYFDPVVEALADRIWTMGANDSPMTSMVCEQAIMTMVGLILQKAAETDKPQESRTTLAPWKLNRALELLSSNLDQPPSIHALAEKVGLSPSHFSRAFTASTGFPPHEWLSRQRIERAKQLLETTDSSTTDIAFELGYSSPNHFASRFRQFAGMSPREWRREHPAPR